ncbi:MAG: hypothetical protein QGH25_18125, partial [Candidatus Latescibacteria bacterium]|nr:hypothetical protein [Candidatus Latescibacterota bacterium]
MLAQTEWKRRSPNGRAARVNGLLPLLLFCLALDARGLTIYRIGNGPPPDLEVPHEFVQWTWEEAAAPPFGQLQTLNLDAYYLAPRRLDATINIAPIIAENGGRTFAFGNYETAIKPSAHEGSAWDGDRDTAFVGDGSILWRWMWSREQNVRFP